MNFDDVLSKMTVPMLVAYADQDTVVLPLMAQHVFELGPTSKAS